MMFCACECLCPAYLLESGEVRLKFCISGWNSTYQPYIESTTVLSDEFIARNDGFGGRQKLTSAMKQRPEK